MFKLLNLFRPTETEIAAETMRARFDRVSEELNAVLQELDSFPKITIDADVRRVEIESPEQFADEALALPKPETSPESSPDAQQTDIEQPSNESDTSEKDKEIKEAGATQSGKSAA